MPLARRGVRWRLRIPWPPPRAETLPPSPIAADTPSTLLAWPSVSTWRTLRTYTPKRVQDETLRPWTLVNAPPKDGSAVQRVHCLHIPPDMPHASEARSIRHALGDILAHPRASGAHARVESVLSRAYATIFASFHTNSADAERLRPLAVALLGSASEALVAIGTQESFDLTRKLLTYAHLHVGSVPLAHFRRMCADLGRHRHAERVRQMERLSRMHHPDTSDQAMWYARLLACSELGQSADLDACWTEYPGTGIPPYSAHAVRVLYYAPKADTPDGAERFRTALMDLVHAGYRLQSPTWLRLFQSYPPLTDLVTHHARRLAVRPPREMLRELLALMQHTFSPYVPVVLKAMCVYESEHMPITKEVRLPPWVHIARQVLPPWNAGASSYAFAASWCGIRGIVRGARAYFELTRTEAGPLPSLEPSERLPQEERHPRVSVEHACIGVIEAYRRVGAPMKGIEFAQRVTGVPLGAQVKSVPSVPRSSLLIASLIRCAGDMLNVNIARTALADGRQHGLRVNGRVRRALAKVLMQCLHAQPNELHRLREQLAFLSARGKHKNEQRKKLRAELAKLGFDDTLQLVQQHRFDVGNARPQDLPTTGQRRVSSPETQLHSWVRDTALQPEAEPSPAGVPLHAADAAAAAALHNASPRGGGRRLTRPAWTARLRLLRALQDRDGIETRFRAMIEQGTKPLPSHVEVLISSLCALRRMREVAWVMQTALPAWQMSPTKHMYTSVVRAYALAGDWRAVGRELEEMRRRGVEADTFLRDTLETVRVTQRYMPRRRPRPDPRGQHVRVRLPRPQNSGTKVTHLAGVMQHFRLLMQKRAFLQAQRFYAECLQKGMVPDYALRRRLKRAQDWMRRHSLSDHPKAQLARELCKANLRASSKAHQAHVQTHKRRSFRHSFVCLIHEIVDGRFRRD